MPYEKWDEDQWIAACLHLMFCEKQDCQRCKQIEQQIDVEGKRKR